MFVAVQFFSKQGNYGVEYRITDLPVKEVSTDYRSTKQHAPALQEALD
jgi:hypothetical protein